jgi:hypothetical protein
LRNEICRSIQFVCVYMLKYGEHVNTPLAFTKCLKKLRYLLKWNTTCENVYITPICIDQDHSRNLFFS